MKKRTAVRLLAMLLMMLMLIPYIASCSNKKAPVDIPSDATVGSENISSEDSFDNVFSSGNATEDLTFPIEPPKEDITPEEELEGNIVLANDNKAFYTILCQKALTDVLVPASNPLSSYIKEHCKQELDTLSSTGGYDAKEIIVGDVDCEAVRKVKSEVPLGSGDFVIRSVGNKIVILGQSNASTKEALNYFASKVITSAKNSNAVYLGANYSFHYDKDAACEAAVIAKEDTFLDFSIKPGTLEETFARLSYTGNKGWRIQTKLRFSDEFNDMGASQRLSVSLGEQAVLNVGKLTFNDSVNTITVKEAGGTSAILSLKDFSLSVYTSGKSLASKVTELYQDETKSIVSTELLNGEAIFGSGSRTTNANQVGQSLEIFTYDLWDKAEQCYLAIPLFSSSRGSGVFVNRYEYMVADIGKTATDKLTVTANDAEMDCYIFATEKIADVIYGYSALSGFPEAPEEWAYGVMFCRYWREFYPKYDKTVVDPSAVNNMIAKMDEYDLPWNGIIMEGWDSDDENLYEEWKKIADAAHARGKKVICYISVGAMPAGAPEEYYLTYTDENGNKINEIPRVAAGNTNPDTSEDNKMKYLDITNPDAVDWYFNVFWDKLVNEIGIDGAKIDFCELIPENYDYNYYDKSMVTKGSHLWYPTAFCTMFYEKMSSKSDGGLNFTRGGGIGSQRNPFMWAGDQTRQFDRLQRQLNLLISSGLSGVPFQSFDMSGYRYADEKNKLDIELEAKIYARACQFTAFTACMQTHGKDVLTPYQFAENKFTAATDIYRIYAKLHETLMPYTSEMADIACETGLPMSRHLVLQWQNDKNVYNIQDEYMYGDAFLIAPELKGNTSRDIYLPEGRWMDLRTGETYIVGAEGKWLNSYSVPLSEIPVFYNMSNTSKTADTLLPAVRELLNAAASIEFKADAV